MLRVKKTKCRQASDLLTLINGSVIFIFFIKKKAIKEQCKEIEDDN